MSDIIDAVAPPTTQLEPGAATEIPVSVDLRVPARDYVRLAQGFYFVFWGLLLTVLTGAQLLMPIDMPPFAESFLGVGVLATLLGSWRLYQVRSLGKSWHQRIRQTFALAMLMTYFCLFFYWWRRVPMSTYLLGNVLAFAVTGIIYVIAFNRVVGVLAAALGRKDMVFESRMFGSGNIGLLLLPFACIIAYIIGMAVLQRSDPISELRFLLGHANLLVIVVLLLPFSLTLSLAWSCKDAVLRQLSALDHPHDPGKRPLMNGYRHRFPQYGTIGLVILLLMETAVFCARTDAMPNIPWWVITSWATPVCWWAYILIVDAGIYRRKGASLLMDRRESFVIQCILSVAFWCLFEAYNRVMPGWRYLNLDPNLSVRLLGYALSFATIMPGMFLTCELLQSYEFLAQARTPSFSWSQGFLVASVAVGAAFVIVPPFMPVHWRGYLWVFVWMGWFLLLEPFNYWRRAQSLYRDWEHGDWSRTLQLLAAGAICGFLWEFWNMWAYTKWIYIFPHGQSPKFFEMPLVGLFGFLPFALEYFVMFHFVASSFTRHDTLEI